MMRRCDINTTAASDVCEQRALTSSVFSERERHVHVRYMLSPVRLSCVVCLSSVTFVHPTQTVRILGNLFTPFGTLAIR